MTHRTDSTPTAEVDESSEDGSSRFDRGMAITFGVLVALACGFTYGSNRIAAEPWRAILVVLAALTGLYAVYLVAAALVVLALGFMIRTFTADHRREGVLLRHWPWGVWPPVVLLGLGWPLAAALAGYDASEWLWQGISIYAGILAILAVFFRRRP